MKLYEARLVLKSPAIVTLRRTERGYVKPYSFVLGSTLRGAIVTTLLHDGILCKDDLEREAYEPRILASVAFPIVDGCRTLPATPFIARCKLCGYILDETRSIAKRLEASKVLEFPGLCPNCYEKGRSSPLEPLHGAPIYFNRDYRIFRPRSFRATSVGIAKRRGSAVRGLLFDYEAIAEGTEFWAWVAVREELELPERLEIAIGRGRSRGFGWAELSLTPARVQPAPERGVFVGLSPLLPLNKLSWGGSSLELNKVLGRTFRVQLGWDMLRGPRPFATLVKPGSLIMASQSCDPAILRTGLPVSIWDTVVVGLNALIPLEEYYGLLRGGVV